MVFPKSIEAETRPLQHPTSTQPTEHRLGDPTQQTTVSPTSLHRRPPIERQPAQHLFPRALYRLNRGVGTRRGALDTKRDQPTRRSAHNSSPAHFSVVPIRLRLTEISLDNLGSTDLLFSAPKLDDRNPDEKPDNRTPIPSPSQRIPDTPHLAHPPRPTTQEISKGLRPVRSYGQFYLAFSRRL
jgi:hypothetical protein